MPFSFALLALLRTITAGYTVPYLVFAAIAIIGGLMMIGVKVVPVVDVDIEGLYGDTFHPTLIVKLCIQKKLSCFLYPAGV